MTLFDDNWLLQAVKWLLKRGAKFLTDKYGKSPQDDAESNHQTEVLSLLEEYQSNSSDGIYEYDEEIIEDHEESPCTCNANDHQVINYSLIGKLTSGL